MYGQFQADVQYKEQKLCLLMIVAGDKGPSLLGRDWLHSLKLDWNTIFNVRSEDLEDLLKTYSSIFNPTLGTLKGFQAKLYVDKDQPPIFCKARSVPYAIRPQVEEELDRLIELQIIEPVLFVEVFLYENNNYTMW